MTTLDILHQDEHCVAVVKPAGMMVHRHRKAEPGEIALQTLRDQLGQWVQPVHRLDRPTSGVLLFALSKEAVARFSLEFEERRAKKTYLALIRGHLKKAQTVDTPLERTGHRVVGPDSEAAPELTALTRFTPLEAFELPIKVHRYPTSRYALIRAEPETGRFHQIRRHLAGISRPIVGDYAHGDNRHNRFVGKESGVERLMLHAAALTLTHPYTGEALTLEAAPGDDFAQVLAWMRSAAAA